MIIEFILNSRWPLPCRDCVLLFYQCCFLALSPAFLPAQVAGGQAVEIRVPGILVFAVDHLVVPLTQSYVSSWSLVFCLPREV